MPRGRVRTYPIEASDYIREHADQKISRLQMVEMVQRDLNVKVPLSYVKQIMLKYSLPYKRKPKTSLVTEEQAQYMISIIPGRSSMEVSEIMKNKYGIELTTAQIRSWKKNHRTPSGYDSRFRLGQTSMNKGRSWAEWMPEDSAEKSRRTCFKKGDIPPNYMPIGSTTVRDGYTLIKVRDHHGVKNWEFLHKVVWEKAHGPIPKGYRIVFINGNRSDCSLENLRCVSKAVTCIANSKFGLTDDATINEMILKAAELKIKIADAEKIVNDKERR